MNETFFNDSLFGFQSSFSMFNIIFIVFLLFFFTVVAIIIFQNVRRFKRNNASPVLTVDATIISKRIDVRQSGTEHSSSGSTYYFVTFSLPSGDRMEFSIHGEEYGMLAERDIGKLTFQGTRYLNFTLN